MKEIDTSIETLLTTCGLFPLLILKFSEIALHSTFIFNIISEAKLFNLWEIGMFCLVIVHFELTHCFYV